jgi:hypothetical protein
MGKVVEKVGDIGQGAINAVGDLGAGIDRTVRDVVPGGWTTAALLAGGYYYAPEINAYVNSSGSTVPASQVVGGAVATPVTQGAVTGTALGELGATSLSPVVAGNVGSFGAVAPVTAGAGAGATGASMSNYLMPAALAGSSVLGASAATSAARTQADAANRAAQLQQNQFERQIELQAPYRQAGERALGKLELASEYTPFGMDQFQQDPGYAFRLKEGQKALEQSAAARGGLISGNALRAATRYGQEMGSQEYTNAFNRYQTERQARLNPLQVLAGVGQSSVNQLGAAGQNYANNAGQAIGAAGQATASGYMGVANAANQGVNQYLNYTQNQATNNLLQQALRNQG